MRMARRLRSRVLVVNPARLAERALEGLVLFLVFASLMTFWLLQLGSRLAQP